MRELAANAIGFVVRHHPPSVDWFAGDWFGKLYLFYLHGFKFRAVGHGGGGRVFADGCIVYLIADYLIARLPQQGHGDVDVLEDAARGDAEHAVGRFDEIVALASAVLAAEMVDEAETGTELLGFDEEACAVCLPLL
ncbi:hypothetical protein SBA2_40042 [Acidobacteriia bacterium SbA2]|nr:hypothetical protein SBA2_40042 [Acidobacteriia bacterium SbA2]